MSAVSILRPAWLLALETARSPAAIAWIVAAVLLDLVSRALLPLAIAASNTRGTEIGIEIRVLLLGGLTLLGLLRCSRWALSLRQQGAPEKVITFIASGIALHGYGLLALSIPEWGFGLRSPALGSEWLLASLWLSSLGGILVLVRLEAAALGLLFLALAWWVPALIQTGIPHATWSASGFLPMLVPQLLGLGYVCLERVHR